MARNLTDPETGFLKSGMTLLHDRDSKYTAYFDRFLKESGVETLRLPGQSPNCNAHAERFVRSVKSQCLSRMIITDEAQLRKALKEYVEYYNHERCHQGWATESRNRGRKTFPGAGRERSGRNNAWEVY
jgi:putative transposase